MSGLGSALMNPNHGAGRDDGEQIIQDNYEGS